MALSRRFYDSLPFYARLIEDELLIHFCDQGIQFALDYLYRALDELIYYFDPDEAIAQLNTPIGGQSSSSNLEWLGNIVGLHRRGDHYLGVGINPKWDIAQKRYAVLNAVDYWQSKGSEKGIRRGTRLWTGWAGAQDGDRLKFFRPRGRGLHGEGGVAWRYDTPLGTPKLKTFWDYPRLGDGDAAPGQKIIHQPRVNGKGAIQLSRSRLGDENSWMVFDFDEDQLPEWNLVFPDQLTLNAEIVPIRVTPVVIGWLNLERATPLVVNWKNEQAVHDIRQWIVTIRTNNRSYNVPVFSSYWLQGAAKKKFSGITAIDGEAIGKLVAEIAFVPEPDDTQLISIGIKLSGFSGNLFLRSFSPLLNIDPRMTVGFRIQCDAIWGAIAFDETAIRIDFDPPVAFAFRQFEIPVTVDTDGQSVSWEQTRGPTVVFNPSTGKSIAITRPNLNDDPYKVRANVQKTFRNGLIAEIGKELLIYTTPASSVDSIVSNCQIVYH